MFIQVGKLSLIFIIGLLVSAGAHPAPLLLSGEVVARNSETFIAPRGDNWIMQIEWMVEEGKRVGPGEPVVQYDTAGIISQLEQREAKLRKVKAESKWNNLTQELEIRQAQHNLKIATLNLENALLDGNISKSLLSQLDYAQYQLEITRKQNANTEAAQALEVAIKNGTAEIRRSQVEIASAENELQRIQRMLDLMTQRSNNGGTALYVDHPWTGQKIRTGVAVQMGFTVLQIPATDDLHIKAWLNEIDIARVRPEQRVKILFEARPSIAISGKIAHIGSQIAPKQYWGNSNYISIDIALNEAIPEGLLPGMSVMVEILETSQ